MSAGMGDGPGTIGTMTLGGRKASGEIPGEGSFAFAADTSTGNGIGNG
jgi:hypothetical protein